MGNKLSPLGKKYGWKPSLPNAHKPIFAARIAPTKLAPFVDMRSQCPAPYNQQQLGSCHDNKTEVLTDSGWKHFSNVRPSDKLASVNPETSEILFETPTGFTRYFYQGEMVSVQRKDLNFSVTPDHTMIVRKWSEKDRTLSSVYERVEAKNLGWYCGLMTNVVWNGVSQAMAAGSSYQLSSIESSQFSHGRDETHIPLSTWNKFLGLYLAEGTMLIENRGIHSNGYKIQIAATKTREKEFCRTVFGELGVVALELKDRFTFSNKQIYTQLESLGLSGKKAPYKFVPSFVFDQDANMIKEFLSGHFAGDGCQGRNRSHYTSSKQMAEDLQRLIFLSGSESRIAVRSARTSTMKDGRIIKGRYPEYRVSVNDKCTKSIRKMTDVTNPYYSGEVFCAEMPTHHTLVTKREGTILISGNCTANAAAGALEFDQIKQKLPIFMPSRLFIYYNERVAEGTVSSDSGASLSESVQALASYGAPPETLWPYNANQFTVKPPANAYTAGAKNKAITYSSVNQDLNSIQSCLASGYPMLLGFTVYDSFESAAVASNGIVPMPAATEEVLGGHAVLAVGYNAGSTTVNGAPPRTFIVRNSWGPYWGAKGYFYMPFEYLLDPNLSDDFWQISHVA